MRRPWELAHRQQRQAGPRAVYVPFSLPDTSAATFAVLELVGFSSSPASSQSSLSPSLSSPLQPPTLCHSKLQYPMQSFDAPKSAPNSHTEHVSPTCLQISPVANMHATSPPVAQKPAVLDGRRVHVVQTHIKENVVHTTSLNFKDVVQQLTGASSSNHTDIMPSTVQALAATPTPAGNSLAANKVPDALSVKVGASKGFKKPPSKLQERRKDVRSLEKLCAADKRLALQSATSTSPMVPSPVTPLAFDFEKFCTAITPRASRSSARSSGVSSPEASIITVDTPIILPYRASIAEHGATSGGGAHARSKLQQYAGPALLNLFPESPM